MPPKNTRIPVADTALRRARGIAGSDEGSLTIFSLFLFVAMVLVGGLAVDLARVETERTRLQSTLDRAVLAAADLQQTRLPEVVVQDYLRLAGFDPDDAEIVVDESRVAGQNELVGRVVTATTARPVSLLFLPMVDIGTMLAPARARAEEHVRNIEVSLVLDISASMRLETWNPRIDNMKIAAKRFVEIVLEGDSKAMTSINIVPYAGQTNPGRAIFDYVGGVRSHAYAASCLELDAADFATEGLPRTRTRAQVPHFMYYSQKPGMDWGWCPQDTMAIRVASNDENKLKSFIDGIRLYDGTGRDYGMKWAAALLSPTSRNLFGTLAAKPASDPDAIDPRFSQRPSDYGTENVEKFIVLMTDGEISGQFRPRFTGLVDHDDDDLDNEKDRGNVEDFDDVDGVDHDLLNAKIHLGPDEDGIKAQKGQYIKDEKKINLVSETVKRETALSRFYKVCEQAKANGVTVYTIAFETDEDGAAEMRECATSRSHFFEVSGIDIANAFSAIARAINPLRLTQ